MARESENSLVPQLILQPLVENSLRHGLTEIDSGIDITIAARCENGSLVLKVRDTGAGLMARKPGFGGSGEGLGLANISRRLEQLYGEDHQFATADCSEGGAEVTLRLPFRIASQPI